MLSKHEPDQRNDLRVVLGLGLSVPMYEENNDRIAILIC